MLIDSHCHLYVEEFDSDRDEVMKRAMDAGIGKFFLPAIDSKTTEAMLLMEKDYPGICFCMAGLHPCSVNENVEEELALVFDMVNRRKFAAIGEIGLAGEAGLFLLGDEGLHVVGGIFPGTEDLEGEIANGFVFAGGEGAADRNGEAGGADFA